MTTNLRYTYINDIKIGYNYPRNQFYVENKETTTYRTELQDIRNVLATLGITTEDISDSTLLFFKNNPETLEKVYYTWEDTGLYVKTLQFNDWKDYALIIDCNKAKIYIMNSTTIFNIETNDSIPIVIAPILCSFYRDTLGLNIPLEKMISFCNFLISFYAPTCINTIESKPEEAEHYLYSNIFKLTNYNNTAVSTYTCTGNPLNTFDNMPIADVVSLSDTTITLAEPISQEIIDTYNIQAGQKVVIQGINENIEGTTYSADGTYTIQGIDNNIITIEETLPIEYMYPFYNCYAVVKEYTITEISREDNSITLSEAPDSILVGDKVIIKGTTITDNPYQTITLDGIYTVQGITGNKVIVEEQLETNFTGSANLIKNAFISSIKSIVTEDNISTLTFLNSTEFNLIGKYIMVYNSSIENFNTYEVQDMIQGEESLYIGVKVEDIGIEPKPLSKLYYPIPSKTINIDVTYSNNEATMPTGEFNVNSFEEAQSYLRLLKNNIVPSNEVGTNMYNKVADSMVITITVIGGEDYPYTIYFSGVYGDVYKGM